MTAALQLDEATSERLARLVQTDDTTLGASLLAAMPTNESRTDTQLYTWSGRAQTFGRGVADRTVDQPPGTRVVERTGGLDGPAPVIARFHHRTSTVELFTDSIDHCERVVEHLGWGDLFPPGSIRDAALAHERAHQVLTHAHAAELRRAVGHPALAIGRWRRWAHVAGADELAAHAFAQRTLGLERSLLLVTAAAMAAVDSRDGSAAVYRSSRES